MQSALLPLLRSYPRGGKLLNDFNYEEEDRKERERERGGEQIARFREHGAIRLAITLRAHNDRFAQEWMSVAPALCRLIRLPHVRAKDMVQRPRVRAARSPTGQRLFIERAAVNGLV